MSRIGINFERKHFDSGRLPAALLPVSGWGRLRSAQRGSVHSSGQILQKVQRSKIKSFISGNSIDPRLWSARRLLAARRQFRRWTVREHSVLEWSLVRCCWMSKDQRSRFEVQPRREVARHLSRSEPRHLLRATRARRIISIPVSPLFNRVPTVHALFHYVFRSSLYRSVAAPLRTGAPFPMGLPCHPTH